VRDRVTGRLLLIVSAMIAIFNATGLTDQVPDPFISGFVPVALASVLAVFLLKKDSSPQTGVIIFTAALVNTSVQLWGGGFGPAVFLYPLLFLWMKRDSIGGPILVIAGALAVIEFIAPVISAAGIRSGAFRMDDLLEVLAGALAAGIIPLVSLFAVEFLKEEKPPGILPSEGIALDLRSTAPGFPDDVARSLIPILKSSTGANGVFLFVRDQRGICILNEFVADSGVVSGRYMMASDDPVMQMLENSSGEIFHTSADILATGGSSGLPWYLQDSGSPWVSVLQFRRNGILSGFMVLDYGSEEKRKNGTSLLLDSSFLLSVSWELVHHEKDRGFLAVCEDMASTSDVRGAVHRLIDRIVSAYPETTASIAIVNRVDTLCVFESMGRFSEGRAGREYALNDGFAGLAIIRRQALRRLKMGMGKKGVRTFSEDDDPRHLVGSCCAVPLEDMGDVLGVLTVESQNEQHFTSDDLFIFSAFATVFSLAVSRNRLLDSHRKLKENDTITGLPLLSTFHDHLKSLISEVRSHALSILVLAVDINGFSRINDRFGYTTGDRVLEKTAKRLKRVLGADAMLSRSCADCFLVCLCGVDRVSADAFAVRIHEEFAKSPLTIAGIDHEIAVCIGGAISHVDRMIVKLPEIAVKLADRCSSKPGFSVITEVGPFYDTKE
jgi:diguanylate cyclase (GGDEF)-like protein